MAVLLDLVVRTFLVFELSDDVIGAELVVESRVEQSHANIINAQVVANHKEPAVGHASEARHTHHVSTVFQVGLKQIQLPIVKDFIVRAQSVVRNLLICHFTFDLSLLDITSKIQTIHLVQSFSGS